MFRTSFFRLLPREFAVLSYRVAQFSMEHAIVLNASSINSDVWEKVASQTSTSTATPPGQHFETQ